MRKSYSLRGISPLDLHLGLIIIKTSLNKTKIATEVPIFTEGYLKMDLEGRRYWGIEIMKRTEKAEQVILGTFPTAL